MAKRVFTSATAELLGTIAFGALFVGVSPLILGLAGATAFTAATFLTIGISALVGVSCIFASTAIKKGLEEESKMEAAQASKTIVITRSPGLAQELAPSREKTEEHAPHFQQKLGEEADLTPRAR